MLKALPTTLLLSLVMVSAATAQQSICQAVLDQGIRDSEQVLDLQSQHSVAQSFYCSAEMTAERNSSGGSGSASYGIFEISGGGGQESFREWSERFCASDFSDVQSDSSFSRAVEETNAVIVAAWSDCIRENRAGLSHFIRPTIDPERFVYEIIYTPDGNPTSVELTGWIATNSTCEPALEAGSVISSAGVRLLCSRDIEDSVIILANADTGTRNLSEVQLPAVETVQSVWGDEVISIAQADWVPAPEERGVALDYRVFIPFPGANTPDGTPSVEFSITFPRSNPDVERNTYTFVATPTSVTEEGFEVMFIKRNAVRSDEEARLQWVATWE